MSYENVFLNRQASPGEDLKNVRIVEFVTNMVMDHS